MPFAMNDGVRIHYAVEGNGQPLLMLHGFTGSCRDWWDFGFVGRLRERYQLIMPDYRGHGASDKPHDTDAYNFDLIARDAIAVLDDLDIFQAHYYGYSFGGLIGWTLGAIAPERFKSMAIGGAHPYEPDSELWERTDRMRGYLSQGMETYVSWRESQIGQRWPEEFRARVLANDPEALLAFIDIDPATPGIVQFDRISRWMSMPVLVISGDDDELFAGSRACLAARALPDATFAEIPDADHFKLYVRSDLVAPSLTAFLDRVSALHPHATARGK